jgi:hypothetical protein
MQSLEIMFIAWQQNYHMSHKKNLIQYTIEKVESLKEYNAGQTPLS